VQTGFCAGFVPLPGKVKQSVDISPRRPVSTTHEFQLSGFIEPQAGYLLSHNMSEQTKLCGTVYKVAVDVTRVDLEKREVVIDDYETVRAKKIVIATGTTPNLTGSSGERELKGKGLSYCATCDGKYMDGKEVVVIGGGNSAVEESEYLTRFASKLTIIHQFDKLTANKQAQDRAFKNPKISVIFNTEPRAFIREGDKLVTETENIKTGVRQKFTSDRIILSLSR
jgi:thioredoxin reductase (NADPH)